MAYVVSDEEQYGRRYTARRGAEVAGQSVWRRVVRWVGAKEQKGGSGWLAATSVSLHWIALCLVVIGGVRGRRHLIG